MAVITLRIEASSQSWRQRKNRKFFFSNGFRFFQLEDTHTSINGQYDEGSPFSLEEVTETDFLWGMDGEEECVLMRKAHYLISTEEDREMWIRMIRILFKKTKEGFI